MDAQIGYRVEIVHDPLAVAEAVVDRLDGARRPTPWMRRLRDGRRGPSLVDVSDDHVLRYAGRACCYQHLTSLEHKVSVDLRPPFETECPGCRRRFRVTIGVTLGGTTWPTTTR